MHLLDSLRPALLLSLSILFLLMLWRRFKHKAMMAERPVAAHAELLALHVEYHPERLRAEVAMPEDGELRPALLDGEHRPLFAWPRMNGKARTQVLELPLTDHADGTYYFELATATQRTVRRFILNRS